MKKIFYITFATVLILYTGCKKVLEPAPQDFSTPETFFNKESDAVAVLNSAFDQFTRNYFYGGYYSARMLIGDDVWSTLTGEYPGSLTITAAEPTHIPPLWGFLYTQIEFCNILLENIHRIEMADNRRNEIMGEAYFLRGYCYFFLADHWGAVPLRLKPTGGPNDVHIARTPLAEVYAQVLADLKKAESMVPTTAAALYGGAGYPAKTTVQGILARVCLTMAGEPLKDASKFQEAKDWAQKVVDSREHALNPDYADIFIKLASNQFDKKEILWEIDFNDITGAAEHGSVGFLTGLLGADVSFGRSVGQARITRKLFNLYGGTADERRDWNCSPFQYTNTTTTGLDKSFYTANQIYNRQDAKWRLEYTPAPRFQQRSPINFPILRYSDILLMLAEAENEINGPNELTYSMVNMVRARAYGKLKPGATNINVADVPRTHTKDTFRKLIQDERCREFPSEALRRHDLIRWGIFVSAIKEVGQDVVLPPAVNSNFINILTTRANIVSNRDLLWPIPASEMTYNSLMTQNPGW